MATYSTRPRSWLAALALAALVLVALSQRADAGPSAFAFPVAPPGTPANYVPVTADTRGNVTYGPVPVPTSIPNANITPGTAGQVLGTNSSTLAAWIPQQSVSVVDAYGAKCDGTTDDSTVFQTAVNALQGTGVALRIPAATCFLGHYVVLPSNITILGTPGAIIKQATGTVQGSVDAAFVSYVISDGSFAATTLSTGNTVGSLQVSTVASVAAGTWIFIGNATPPAQRDFRQAIYQVQQVSGAGPFTLTLDRPTIMQFSTGDDVQPIISAWNSTYQPAIHTIPQNIQILGNGMKITGTGARFLEIESSRNVLVQDVTFDTSGGAGASAMWMSFDVGSYNCEGRRIYAYIPFGLAIGGTLSMESTEQVRYVDSLVQGLPTSGHAGGATDSVGFLGFDAQQSTWKNDNAIGLADGVRLMSGVGSGSLARLGSQHDRIEGGRFIGNSFAGIHVGDGPTYGSQDITIDGVMADSNGVGVYLDTYAIDGRIANSIITNNNLTGYGIWLNATGPGVGPYGWTASNVNLSGNAVGLSGGDVDFVLSNVYSTGNANSLVYWVGANATSGQITLDGFNVSSPASPVFAGLLRADGGGVVISNGRAIGSGGGSMVTLTANSANLRTSNVRLESSGTETCINVATGTAANLGTGTDIAGCSTPYANAGTLTLNSANTAGTATLDSPTVAIGGTLMATYGIGSNATTSWTQDVSTNTGYVFEAGGNPIGRLQTPVASAFASGLWLGNVTNTDAHTTLAVDSSGNTYLNASGGTALYFGVSGYNLQETSGDLSPFSVGGNTLGAAHPFGAAFIGAGNAGYTSFPAISGTHNTQDNIFPHSIADGRFNASYSAVNFNTYTIPAAHHGVGVTCTATARVVTSASGTGCTNNFWTAATHGAADTLFRCTVAASGGWSGSTSTGYSAPFYSPCDVTTSTNPSTGTSITSVLIFSATLNTGTGLVTVQWAPFNDTCSVPPVIDVTSACDWGDN